MSSPSDCRPVADEQSSSSTASEPDSPVRAPSEDVCSSFAGLGVHTNANPHIEIPVKLLVSQGSAGVLIGKGGGKILQLREASKCSRFQLSRAGHLYPGTPDRILVVQGNTKSVLTAMYLVLRRLMDCREPTHAPSGREASSSLRMVCPSTVCGALIGRSGATISSFITDSGANISLSPLKASGAQPHHERLITVAGQVDNILRAVALILSKVSTMELYFTSMSLRFGNGAMPPAHPLPGGVYQLAPGPIPCPPYPPAVLGFYAHPHEYGPVPHHTAMLRAPPVAGPPPMVHVMQVGQPPIMECTLLIPEEQVGALTRKRSAAACQIPSVVAGVSVALSARDTLELGRSMRRCTISGPPELVVSAQTLILQRLEQHSACQPQFQR